MSSQTLVTRVLDPEGAHLAALRRLGDFEGRRVLELGCGDGRLTLGIAAGRLLEQAVDDHDVLKHYKTGADLIDDFADKERRLPDDAALRHTHAVELDNEGTPVRVIRDRLGHSSIATTDRYLQALGASDTAPYIKNRR